MNSKLFIFFIILSLLSACGGEIQSRQGVATLHALILTDTNDKSIGASAQVDLQKMKELVESISEYTGLALNGHYLYGDKLNYDGVMTTLDKLSVGRDDVVIFYYAGHGSNPGRGGRWPTMTLKDRSLALKSVFDLIKNRNPRLFLVMADTCNNLANNKFYFSNPRSPDDSITSPENYQQLFLNPRGHIIASSSKPGQLSWSNSQAGGFFTYQWLMSLHIELAGDRPSWQSLMKRADRVIHLPNGKVQNPQSKVDIIDMGVSPPAMDDESLEGENNLEFQWLLEESEEESDPSKWH
jgi:hypothetical protein